MRTGPGSNLLLSSKARHIGMLFLGAILFGLAYSQSPLFTSNQNQYFLHGLAAAGFGYLRADWLANTADPTPLYSFIVELTYLIFKSSIPFYLYYFGLLGLYYSFLIELVKRLTDGLVPQKIALLGTILLILHSALWRYLLTLTLGPEWAYVVEGGLANQRLLGVVFQPSTFGVFLFGAVYAFVIGKDLPGLLMIALAIYFHPTYLLAGMILVLAFMVNNYLERKTLRFAFSYGLLFLFLVSPVLLYVFSLIRGESSEAVSQAQHILVYYRIPHHALIDEWFESTSVVQIIIMIIGGIVLRRRSSRLFSIAGISFVLMALLSVVQYISSNETLALAFPWRLSTVLVPLATCAVIVRLVDTIWRYFGDLAIERAREFHLLLGALLVIVVTAGIARFQIEVNQQRTSPEFALIDFVRQEKRPGDVYLIPPKMQDFRLASGAPIYIDFKSIPYRPEEVLEWYRRIRIVEEFYGSRFPDCSGFLEWAITEEVNHAVVFPDSEVITCPGWKIIFEDNYYILLKRTG